mmetsp:Transcript_34101/g.55320  ORF Transcript_34101/g.55320 Transcript_34101/m.55320 type:complete len:234 (-) Transcript_34101:1390-2091(-)
MFLLSVGFAAIAFPYMSHSRTEHTRLERREMAIRLWYSQFLTNVRIRALLGMGGDYIWPSVHKLPYLLFPGEQDVLLSLPFAYHANPLALGTVRRCLSLRHTSSCLLKHVYRGLTLLLQLQRSRLIHRKLRNCCLLRACELPNLSLILVDLLGELERPGAVLCGLLAELIAHVRNFVEDKILLNEALLFFLQLFLENLDLGLKLLLIRIEPRQLLDARRSVLFGPIRCCERLR